MKADRVIKNGIVVTPLSTLIGGVAVKGTQIVAVGSDALGLSRPGGEPRKTVAMGSSSERQRIRGFNI